MKYYAVHLGGKLAKWSGGTGDELNEETLTTDLEAAKRVAEDRKGIVFAYKAGYHYLGPVDREAIR